MRMNSSNHHFFNRVMKKKNYTIDYSQQTQYKTVFYEASLKQFESTHFYDTIFFRNVHTQNVRVCKYKYCLVAFINGARPY